MSNTFNIGNLVKTQGWKNLPSEQKRNIAAHTFGRSPAFNKMPAEQQQNILNHYASKVNDYSDMYGTADNEFTGPVNSKVNTPANARINPKSYGRNTPTPKPSAKKQTASTKKPMNRKPGPKKPGPVRGSKNVPKVAAKRSVSANPFSKDFSWGAFGLDNAAVRKSDAKRGIDTSYGRKRKRALTAEASAILDLF